MRAPYRSRIRYSDRIERVEPEMRSTCACIVFICASCQLTLNLRRIHRVGSLCPRFARRFDQAFFTIIQREQHHQCEFGRSGSGGGSRPRPRCWQRGHPWSTCSRPMSSICPLGRFHRLGHLVGIGQHSGRHLKQNNKNKKKQKPSPEANTFEAALGAPRRFPDAPGAGRPPSTLTPFRSITTGTGARPCRLGSAADPLS